ncbi:60S ribosomal protein L6 [Labeo rohita]|uniref:60S ribosomal protein L6 n=1 Tax=Labeo rohita TaxID=84645 RepID=A0ABQ8LX76_LABRO|nr:60S ribosomal protein L6 [Labeo rohita]
MKGKGEDERQEEEKKELMERWKDNQKDVDLSQIEPYCYAAVELDGSLQPVCVHWDGEQSTERKWRRLREECEVVLLEQELVWAAKRTGTNGSSSGQEKRRLQPALHVIMANHVLLWDTVRNLEEPWVTAIYMGKWGNRSNRALFGQRAAEIRVNNIRPSLSKINTACMSVYLSEREREIRRDGERQTLTLGMKASQCVCYCQTDH